MEQSKAIEITGTGQNETITIPGVNVNINAKELLEEAKMKIAPILIENGVREIDTSPIPDMDAQGLKRSDEPGKIHIDIQKIFNLAKSSFPPTIQFDGSTIDPDLIDHLVKQITYWLSSEIYETMYHESIHEQDMLNLWRQNKPFTLVREEPAEHQGKQFREKYFPTNQSI